MSNTTAQRSRRASNTGGTASPVGSFSASSPALNEQLKRHVTSGAFSPGDRYLTVRELSRRFRVSPVTVQRTVRDLVKEGVLEVRGNAGTFVGLAARAMPVALHAVHVIAPDLPSQRERIFKLGLADGLLSAMPGVSMQLHLLPATEPTEFLNSLYQEGVTQPTIIGALLLRVPRSVREFFARRKLPAVVFGNVEDHIDLPYIDRDQRAIGEALVHFLAGKGHQRFGLLMMDAWNPGDNHLLHGIQQAMAEAKLSNTAMTLQSVPEEPEMIHALIRRIASQDSRPTALICRSDAIAIEAVAELAKLGLNVPRDMAVVSIGNDGSGLQQVRPTITAMANSHETRGRLAGELLMAMFRGKESPSRRIVSPVELIEREST